MKPRRNPVIPVLIALILLTAAPSLRAEVRDNAGFFSEDALRQANFDLRDIKQRYGKELLIETHPTIPADLQPQLKQLGEDAFYAQWTTQRAQEAKVDGVAVLITKEPSHLHVMVGNRAIKSGALTTADGAKVKQQLLVSFREKQYDQGLLSAVRTFREMFATNRGGAGATPAPVERAPAAAPSAQPAPGEPQANPGAFEPRGRNAPNRGEGGGGFSLWKLIIWGVIILIAVRVISRLFRGRGAQQQQQQQQPGGLFGRPGGFGRGRYGQQGPDPRYGGGAGGGMGGFGTGLGGGLLGGLLGGWLGGRMMGGGGESTAHGAPPPTAGTTEPGVFADEHDANLASSGTTFNDAGGGDFGGGGDFDGGGDAGGGDF